MALLKSPVLIICCILFIAHQVAKLFYAQDVPFVDGYLDTILAMPIILTLLLFERRYIFKWKDYYRLTILETIVATLFVAIVSEILFPALSDDFTGDWLDRAGFITGSVIFYFTINPKPI